VGSHSPSCHAHPLTPSAYVQTELPVAVSVVHLARSAKLSGRVFCSEMQVLRSVSSRQDARSVDRGPTTTMAAAVLSMAACGITLSRSVTGHHVSVQSHSPRSTALVMIFRAPRRRRALWRAESLMQLTVDEVATDLREVQDAYMTTWRQNKGLKGMAALAAAYRLSCISPLLDAHLELHEQARMCQQTQLIIRQKPFKSISNLTQEMKAPILQLQLQREKVREESSRVALRCVSRIKNEADLFVEYSEAELSRARLLDAMKTDARGQAAPRLLSPSLAFTIRNGSEVVKLSPAAPPRDFIGGVVQTDKALKGTSTGGASDSDSTDRATGSSAGG
jgi:hypothetical protein